MSHLAPVIVLIEDDLPIRRFLRTGLTTLGFILHEAGTGKQGIVEAQTRKPDLLILDLGLPDMDGVDVIKAVRSWSAVPIIILSARSQEQVKVDGLDAGADDYLTKPFGFGELLARIRVALRHATQTVNTGSGELFSSDGLIVDFQQRVVTVGNREVHLTPIQYRLLTVLIKHAGKVLTHQQILKEVWGPSSQENAHYLRIYMSQLRQKIEADPTQPKHLLTESGVGYRFKI